MKLILMMVHVFHLSMICTDDTMFNYNPNANTDFGGLLCVPYIDGYFRSNSF